MSSEPFDRPVELRVEFDDGRVAYRTMVHPSQGPAVSVRIGEGGLLYVGNHGSPPIVPPYTIKFLAH